MKYGETMNRYDNLLNVARFTAAKIISLGSVFPPSNPRSAYIYLECRKLCEAWSACQYETGTEPPYQMLDLLVENWEGLANGSLTGVEIMHSQPGLWKQSNSEWLMGIYADLATRVMVAHGYTQGDLFEFGAGGGATSDQIEPYANGRYLKTDIAYASNPELLEDGYEHWDFHDAPRWSEFDTVFGTNALHCSKDKLSTLLSLRAMLKDDGVLVLSEGSPHTAPALPFALNMVYGMFDGWWDVGGFLHRSEWERLLEASGFYEVQFMPLVMTGHDLGGVITAKPFPGYMTIADRQR